MNGKPDYLFKHGGNEVLVSGVDLQAAKRFCRSPKTANVLDGWFVGFTEDDLPVQWSREEMREQLLKLWNSGVY